jgi:hypothetical protein
MPTSRPGTVTDLDQDGRLAHGNAVTVSYASAPEAAPWSPADSGAAQEVSQRALAPAVGGHGGRNSHGHVARPGRGGRQGHGRRGEHG